MVVKLEVEGYEEFKSLIQSINNDKTIIVLFSGSVDESGKSWCPDCVKAEPVIEECLKKAEESLVYLHVDVGERTVWKDPNNPFRKDDRLKLKAVPTLLRWGTQERLVEAEVWNPDMVRLLLED